MAGRDRRSLGQAVGVGRLCPPRRAGRQRARLRQPRAVGARHGRRGGGRGGERGRRGGANGRRALRGAQPAGGGGGAPLRRSSRAKRSAATAAAAEGGAAAARVLGRPLARAAARRLVPGLARGGRGRAHQRDDRAAGAAAAIGVRRAAQLRATGADTADPQPKRAVLARHGQRRHPRPPRLRLGRRRHPRRLAPPWCHAVPASARRHPGRRHTFQRHKNRRRRRLRAAAVCFKGPLRRRDRSRLRGAVCRGPRGCARLSGPPL
mmetsp:Transcript_34440/g.110626  ORF Transcript_34440/g.110626 Transcript_34440/m.110626 type:complete len:264 (-) Transcript_34440:178-969(-)